MLLIGICGSINTGKGAAAKVLEQEFNFTPFAFADPLKCICRDYLKVPANVLWGASEERTNEARRALQSLGKWGRDQDPEIWVNTLCDRVNEWHEMRRDSYNVLQGLSSHDKNRIVVTDVRMPLEAQTLVDRYGAKLIKITRENDTPEDLASDETETSVTEIPEDLFMREISNDRTLEDLEGVMRTLAQNLIDVTNS